MSFRRLAQILTVTLIAVFAVAALASTQVSNSTVLCGNKGPFPNRTDGVCFDKGMYGTLRVTNGTAERVLPGSLMVEVFNDFLGNFKIPDVDSADGEQGVWGRQDAGSQATCGTSVADYDDGAVILLLDNGNEVGDCSLYFGDEQNIDSDKEPVMIARVQVSDALAAADQAFWGFTSARNAIWESTTVNAGFAVSGADYGLDVTSDDSSTDTALDDTGVTLTADTYYDFMVCMNTICGGSPTDVRFYYRAANGGDWTRVQLASSSVTYSIGTDKAIQPMFHVEKTSGTTTPGIQVDWVVVYWERS